MPANATVDYSIEVDSAGMQIILKPDGDVSAKRKRPDRAEKIQKRKGHRLTVVKPATSSRQKTPPRKYNFQS